MCQSLFRQFTFKLELISQLGQNNWFMHSDARTQQTQDFNKLDRNSLRFTTDVTNIILNDLKNLSTLLKTLNQGLYEANNTLLNKLLTMQDITLVKFMEDLLFHMFMVGQILSLNKNFNQQTLVNLVAKLITIANLLVQKGFVICSIEQSKCRQDRDIKQQERKSEKSGALQKVSDKLPTQSKILNQKNYSLRETLFRIIDILSLLKANKSGDGLQLRIIQTAFTLINRSFLFFTNHDYLIKLYGICFQCCLNSFKTVSKDVQVLAQKAMVQNISISALSALTETIFSLGLNHQPQASLSNPVPVLSVLEFFLQFILRDKKFHWLNDNALKGVVWDLIIIAIRNLDSTALNVLSESDSKFTNLNQLLLIMYNYSADSSINTKSTQQPTRQSIFNKSITMIDQNYKKPSLAKQKSAISNSLKKGSISDFVRFYKAFIYFSIHLWAVPKFRKLNPIVPFDAYLNKMALDRAVEAQENRSIKLYLLIQGIYLLLLSKPDLSLTEERGYSLLEIVSKISQQIFLSHSGTSGQPNQRQALDVKWWDIEQIFLDKMCGQFNDVTDSDLVRLIRSTLIRLRIKFQTMDTNQFTSMISNQEYQRKSDFNGNRSYGDQSFLIERSSKKQMQTEPIGLSQNSISMQISMFPSKASQHGLRSASNLSKSERQKSIKEDHRQKTARVRWHRMVKAIIRSVRYLSSVNYKATEGNQQRQSYGSGNEEQPSRKLLLQLQHWFMIAPFARVKNVILHELCVTSSFVQTRAQAIKSSQCAQIGTNIIYGYFDIIDSTGLAFLLKMIAGVKVDVDEGKGFNQLEQVSRIAIDLFVKKQKTHESKRSNVIVDTSSFTKTLQGFVQCVSTLIADIQMPSNQKTRNISTQQLNPRYVKMISFLISKFTIIVTGNQEWLEGKNWSFVSAFFITLCTNKHQTIQLKGIKYLGQIFKHFLNENRDFRKQRYEKTIELSPSNSKFELEYINEDQIMSIYSILSKCKLAPLVLKQVLTQLKEHLFLLSSQQALMKAFSIVKDLYEMESQGGKAGKGLAGQILEMQEILIKDCLYKVTRVQYLRLIIGQFGQRTVFTDKNMQYNMVNLIWAIADHFKKLFIFIHQQEEESLKEQYKYLWTLLFDKLLHLSLNSKQPEFKQSVFHALTQIIAQNFSILNQIDSALILRLMTNNYLSMLFVLFDIPAHDLQNQIRVEMTKFAAKNYLKLIRKLVRDKLFSQNTEFLGNIVNQRLYDFISSETQVKILTVQYLYQMCLLIQQVLEEPIGFDYLKRDILEKLFLAIKQKKGLLDPNTLCYRRKLQPLLEQLQPKIISKDSGITSANEIKDAAINTTHAGSIKKQELNEDIKVSNGQSQEHQIDNKQ